MKHIRNMKKKEVIQNIKTNKMLKKLSQKLLAFILKKTDKINRNIYHKKKKFLFKNLKGTIAELGPGTGLNLEYYPKNIKWIGIEPNSDLREEITNKAKKLKMKNIIVKNATAEKIPIKSNSVETVISTLMLCSVKDVKKTIKEVHRILKPNGKFIFIEHVAGKPNTLRKSTQNLLAKSPYLIISDNCHPNRDIGNEIKKSKFKSVNYKTYFQHKDRSLIDKIFMFPINPHIYGYAIKE
jgi:ubiquinone/menaquinone biosynthesis C-methylase UbiE